MVHELFGISGFVRHPCLARESRQGEEYSRTCRNLAVYSAGPCSLQILSSSILLSVKLPGSSTVELLRVSREATEYVGDLKDVIIAKFKKRFVDVDPDELQLIKLDGSRRIALSPAQTLIDAGVCAGTELAVEITVARACEELGPVL
jgi:hypothetical protein